jgi:hypothetical protein
MRSAPHRLAIVLLVLAQVAPALRTPSCCLPDQSHVRQADEACPLHDDVSREEPAGVDAATAGRDAAHHVAGIADAESCRLACGASHALSQGPSGLLPGPVAVLSSGDAFPVVPVEEPSSRSLRFPPLSPPPRV